MIHIWYTYDKQWTAVCSSSFLSSLCISMYLCVPRCFAALLRGFRCHPPADGSQVASSRQWHCTATPTRPQQRPGTPPCCFSNRWRVVAELCVVLGQLFCVWHLGKIFIEPLQPVWRILWDMEKKHVCPWNCGTACRVQSKRQFLQVMNLFMHCLCQDEGVRNTVWSLPVEDQEAVAIAERPEHKAGNGRKVKS